MDTLPLSLRHQEIGRRIAAARKQRGLNQEELSKSMEFNDRQTLQAIEAGVRAIQPAELVKAATLLGRRVEDFTDPFLLLGEGAFSFRARGAGTEALNAFEEAAGRWVAFFRDQGRRQGVCPPALRHRLDLDEKATFAAVEEAAERLWTEWNLGDVPAERLQEAIETKLGLLVLFVDAPPGISGAACQVSGGDTILVNRNEPEGRRNFDLAHELFHVLTWHAMPPERVDLDNPQGSKAKRVEQLANGFASALLMPARVLKAAWEAGLKAGMPVLDLVRATARRLRVTGMALRVRLSILKLIGSAELFDLPDDSLREPPGPVPPPFSRRFLERAAWAVERGHVSVMRLIHLLGATGRGGLVGWMQEHGLPVPEEI